MPTLYYLVGLPASGKSTYARELEESKGIVRLSSDDLREELFGSRTCQDKNNVLFEEMNKRTRNILKQGKDVIYDATNINSKKRKNFIKQMPNNVIKKCIFFVEDRHNLDLRDLHRDTTVGYDVIERMYKTLQIPMEHEGWDSIEIITTNANMKNSKEILYSINSHEEYLEALETLNLQDVIDVSQDTPYHTLSVSRHMYYAFDYIKGLNISNDKNLSIAAMLHDIGKPRCKEFKGKYASYYGHENVSSQKAVLLLKKLGFKDEDVIHISTLIQLHMRLHKKEFGSKSKEKFRNEIGEVLYSELVLLNNADSSAK